MCMPMGKLRQKEWLIFSKARELVSYRAESSNSKVQLPWCSSCLPLEAAPWAPLICYSGRVNTWRMSCAQRACWVEYQVRVHLHFLATEGFGDNRSPFVLSGAGWSKRMSEGDYKQLWILLVMPPSADAFFNWLVACTSRIGNARCIYCSERECWRPLERHPAVEYLSISGGQGSLTLYGLVTSNPGSQGQTEEATHSWQMTQELTSLSCLFDTQNWLS